MVERTFFVAMLIRSDTSAVPEKRGGEGATSDHRPRAGERAIHGRREVVMIQASFEGDAADVGCRPSLSSTSLRSLHTLARLSGV